MLRPMQQRRLPSSERRVRLFHGRNQAVRIPRDFELEGDEAILRKDGDQLILQPVETGRLLVVLARLKPLQEEFPDIDEGLPPLDDVAL